MKLLTTEITTNERVQSDPMLNEWIYNALDCSVTDEVWEEIFKDARAETLQTYDFVRAMQTPAMLMALRGIRIDMVKRNKWIAEMGHRVETLQRHLDAIAEAIWDQPLNPRSPQQLKDFFYTVMRCEKQYKYDKIKKERVVSCDRNALEALTVNFHARPIVSNILRSRELVKRIGTLQTGIDADERMRTSYNVCGTETGRWSSNSNAFGTGTNFQNWEDYLREIFIADKGWKMAYIDGEQAESRVVGYISGDENYIRACEGGDLHTAVAKMVWPDLEWTGVLKEDKQVAGQKAYRDMSFRDLAKRLGHGTNYRGKPRTMAMHTHVEVKLIEEFQDLYFSAFPGIRKWHQSVAEQLQTHGAITTPLGRTRVFLGRLDSDDTLKEAIAFVPQSTIGEIINEGMWRVWKKFDREDAQLRCQLLAQVHDAILIQYPDVSPEYEVEIIEAVKRTMEVPIPINGRTLVIPANCEGVGWNWRKFDAKENPQGLKKAVGNDDRFQECKENTPIAGRFFL